MPYAPWIFRGATLEQYSRTCVVVGIGVMALGGLVALPAGRCELGAGIIVASAGITTVGVGVILGTIHKHKKPHE